MMKKTEINMIVNQLSNRIITEFLFLTLTTLLFDLIKDENDSDQELKQIQQKKFLSIFMKTI